MINKLMGYRKAIKESQLEFSKHVDIAYSTYGRKERDGNIDFTLEEIKNIIGYLKEFYPDVTVEDIFF